MATSISTSQELQQKLLSLDGKPAALYASLAGAVTFGDFTLFIDQVPERPDTQPARLRASVPVGQARFPRDVFTPKSREIAARDFIIRAFADASARQSAPFPGIRGGRFGIERPGQEMLETTAVVLGEGTIEARFTLDLPVSRGKIPSAAAIEVLLKRIPALVRESMFYETCDGDGLVRWIETAEDADILRSSLAEQGLVAFIADGSILPRRTSMEARDIVSFLAPDDLAMTIELPNRGEIRGMGIPTGITLIAGGCSQGKTTLLRALELGIYNHIPGDGRELVVSLPDAVGLRADEGRRVERVDISPVISTVAKSIDTRHYSSKAAPAAASLAAGLMEALEIGSSVLVFDDETVPPPLVSRDARIQALVPPEEEPQRTLVDILPRLRDEHGISSIIVSSSGDYFDIADSVLVMRGFLPVAATAQAAAIAHRIPSGRKAETTGPFPLPSPRSPYDRCLEPPHEEGNAPRPRPTGRGYIQHGDEWIDASNITQIVTRSQGRAIARAIALVDRLMDGSSSMKDAIQKVMRRIDTVGADTLSNRLMGDLAVFRAHELAAVINRLKNLKIK